MKLNWQEEVDLMEQKHMAEVIEQGQRLTELYAEVERLEMENLNLKEALKASQNN